MWEQIKEALDRAEEIQTDALTLNNQGSSTHLKPSQWEFTLFMNATVPAILNDSIIHFINYTTPIYCLSGNTMWFLFKFKLCISPVWQEIWPFTCLSLLPTNIFFRQWYISGLVHDENENRTTQQQVFFSDIKDKKTGDSVITMQLDEFSNEQFSRQHSIIQMIFKKHVFFLVLTDTQFVMWYTIYYSKSVRKRMSQNNISLQ